ncbi:MAG: right-handed parallel beta-helix repeat-containing protein [Planctomycetes bacterium]|nr:right-handed parallel beta-helix repeat-containing protein [Planctomycetota bacterium]
MSIRSLRVVSIVLAAAPFAVAGGVGNVSRSPVVVHADLQAAIDAAADGDVLVAHGGNYSGFTIDNRSLAIFAVPGETVHVQGKVEIKNLPSSKRVVLSDLDIDETIASGLDGTHALYVSNCTGSVWIQSCTLTGADGVDTGTSPDGGFGGAGVELLNATSVVLVSSTLEGGAGGDIGTTSCFPACWLPGEGGAGLWLRGSSRAALYDCDALGGHGGNGGYQASQGGHGISNTASSGSLFASNTSASGGDGGASVAWQNGDGGDGLRTPASPTVSTLLGSSFTPGVAGTGSASNPGSDGVPVFGAALQLAPSARRFSTEHVARAASSISASLGGEAGDRYFAPKSTTTAWLSKLATNGVWTIRYPAVMPTTPLAILPFDGSVVVNWNTPQVPIGAQTALCFSQGYVLPPSGGAVLASPACTLLLDVDALPDCDANGVFDVLDVVEGASDANHDFVLDSCQQTWFVDDSAPPGGDGSVLAPFDTLAGAFTVATSGNTIVLRDGTYVGPSNRELSFGSRALTVRSENGAGQCTIDCQSAGRAFLGVGNGASTLEGLHILDGRATDSVGGGAVAGTGSGLVRIRDCVFERCRSTSFGGALTLRAPTITNCTFIDCSASSLGSGGALFSLSSATEHLIVADCDFVGSAIATRFGAAIWCDGDALVTRCDFAGGLSSLGGATTFRPTQFLDVSHCRFAGNLDDLGYGGAMYVESGSSTPSVRIDDCLFIGNEANEGGALWLDAGTCSVTNSTFVGNRATMLFGGAASFQSGSSSVRNCIFWNNTAPTGSQLAVLGGSLDVAYCDVLGGATQVHVGGAASSQWLAGNLDVDPEFVDADGADNDPLTFGDNVYRLKPASPCVDAGDALNVPSDFTDIDGDLDFDEPVPLDLNLKPRFADLPSIPDTGVGYPPIDLGCYERQN